MGKYEKLLTTLLEGRCDTNIGFQDICNRLVWLGFEERIRSSHHIFRKEGVAEKPNLQVGGKDAKPYQIKQVRSILLKHSIQGK